MGAGEEIGRTVIQITSKASVMTLQTILRAVAQTRNKTAIVTGEQSLQDLSAKNVPLDKVPISNVDIRMVRDILNSYGVDFSVVKDRGTQDFTLFFKGTDTVAITAAFEELLRVNGLDKDMDKQSDLTEQETEPADMADTVHEATQRSEQHNQAVATERTADRYRDTPKPKGTEQNL